MTSRKCVVSGVGCPKESIFRCQYLWSHKHYNVVFFLNLADCNWCLCRTHLDTSEFDSELILDLKVCFFCAMVLFMNNFARCERIGPCRPEWERHFNQSVMFKLLNQVLSKASQVNWLGGVTDLELLYEMSSLPCDAGVALLYPLQTCLFKKENLWCTWLAVDCCMEAIVNDCVEHGKI